MKGYKFQMALVVALIKDPNNDKKSMWLITLIIMPN